MPLPPPPPHHSKASPDCGKLGGGGGGYDLQKTGYIKDPITGELHLHKNIERRFKFDIEV